MNENNFEKKTAGSIAPAATEVPPPDGKIKVPALETMSLRELQTAVYPPLRFAVDGLIPEGLSVLAGASKSGKSWMVFDLILCVAEGQPFLGRNTTKTRCLYLALEDGNRRLQDRMKKILKERVAPDSVDFAIEALSLKEGLLIQLDDYMEKHPQTGVIVIDALQCVRDIPAGNLNAYAVDYRDLRQLKAIADKWKTALLLVHHVRKSKDPNDPFKDVSGSTGITGVADTSLVLEKENRKSCHAVMHITGRDVETFSDVLVFDKATCRWNYIGDADELEEQRERQSYESDPIVKVIRTLLDREPDGWSGTAAELLDTGRTLAGRRLAFSPRGLSYRLERLEDNLLRYDNIVHTRRRNGSGGGLHILYRKDDPAEIEVGGNGINDCNGRPDCTDEGNDSADC